MRIGISAAIRPLVRAGLIRNNPVLLGLPIAVVLALGIGLHLLRDTAPAELAMPPTAIAMRTGVEVTVLPESDIPADSKPLSWVASGRWQPAPNGKGLLHEWPGLGLFARFAGSTVYVSLDDASNRFRLRIDGEPVALLTRPGKATIRLSGLGEGPHNLHLERLSEAWSPAQIIGIFVPPSGAVLTASPLPTNRIDFFGDSDSVGYGNTSTSRTCPGENVFLLTDATQAWPALLAEHFHASPSVMARSGIGLVRNLSGSTTQPPMAVLHDRLLPSDPSSAVPSTHQPAPWLTVLALGDNDFSVPLEPTEPWLDKNALMSDFVRALDHLLRTRLRDFPGRPILLLSYAELGQDAHIGISAVSRRLAAEGQPVFDIMLPRLDRRACHWHPSLDDHRMIADRLILAIDDLINTGTLKRP